MENKNDIGKSIQKKLALIEKTPRNELWLEIEHKLNRKKKKRRIAFILFWSKILSIFIIAGLIRYFYFQNSDKDFQSIKKTNSVNNSSEFENDDSNASIDTLINHKKSNDIIKKPEINENLFVQKNDFSKEKRASNYFTEKKKINKELPIITQNKTDLNNNSTVKNNLIALDTIVTKNSFKVLNIEQKNIQKEDEPNQIKKSKKREIFEKKDIIDTTDFKDSKQIGKFKIDFIVSPTILGFISSKTNLDERLKNNSTNFPITFSYGAGLTYSGNSKISLRIGYQKLNLKCITKNALINTSNYNGIDYKIGISNQSLYTEFNNTEKMDIIQSISYSEIPVEIQYRFFQKKIELNYIVGMSMLYLEKNSISVKTDTGFNKFIGKTSDLLNSSISASIGIQLSHEAFKKTKIFIKPRFNYQLIAYNNNMYKPYFIDLQTGVQYSF